MRVQSSICLLLCLTTASVLANDRFQIEDEADRINYTIGHQIGTDYRKQDVELDEKAMRLGLQHGQVGQEPEINRNEMQDMLIHLKRDITNKLEAESIAKIKERRRLEMEITDKGKAFMEEYQHREGVKTMPSGLEYRVIKQGKGPKPGLKDYVTIEYEAKTVDGFVFDSSKKKGGPVTYRADSVTPGFTEAIQMMQPGAKWEIVMPPKMAYGRQGPFAHHTIILEVELLSINTNRPKINSIELSNTSPAGN